MQPKYLAVEFTVFQIKMTSLRSKDNPVFGFPSQFPPNQLPTHGDVLKVIMLYHEQLKESTQGRLKLPDLCDSVAQDLTEIWKKASLPTLTHKSISRKVKAAYDEARKCEYSGKPYEDKEKLFEVCACQCPRTSCEKVDCRDANCQKIHIQHNRFQRKCNVNVDDKELPFLFDQRGDRQMTMGGIDKKGSVELQLQNEKDIRREERLKKQQEREEKEKQCVCTDLTEQM